MSAIQHTLLPTRDITTIAPLAASAPLISNPSLVTENASLSQRLENVIRVAEMRAERIVYLEGKLARSRPVWRPRLRVMKVRYA